MSVAATPYQVDIPYAVLETNGDNEVLSLKEKPKYTYYSNAGIYIIKKDLLQITDENFDEFKADVESGRMRRSQIQEKFKIKSRVAFIRLLAMYDLTPNFYQYIMPIETHDKLGSVEWCKRIVEEKYNGHFPGAQTIASIELDDVVGPDVVRAWFERHGLPFASSLVEEIHPQLLNRKWMEVEYKTKSIREIADEVGVSHPIISRFLTHHNIEIKQESHTSKGEKQVLNFIKQYYKGQIIENDRIIIGPKELDIVLPDLKIAIEYCGMYWHCEKMARDPRNIHSNKRKLAEERGYRLITIFENEWLEKDSRKKIKNKILSINIILSYIVFLYIVCFSSKTTVSADSLWGHKVY